MKKYFLMAVCVMAMCMGVSSCGSKDEDIFDALNRDYERKDAYWGKSHSGLYGIWVNETEKDVPNAGFVEIKSDGWYSVYIIEPNRTCSGRLASRLDNLYSVQFLMNNGERRSFTMKWADDTKTRVEVYNEDSTGEPIKETKRYWIKVDKVPSAWSNNK